MSSSIKSRKKIRIQRCSNFESPQEAPNYDTYIDAFFNKSNFSLRSFAMGLPYFETSSQYNSSSQAIVNDIIAGRLTPLVLQLFEGVDPNTIGDSIPCFVTDSRQSILIKYSITLDKDQVPERKSQNESSIKSFHAYKLSDSNFNIFPDEKEIDTQRPISEDS